jgi:hypothetical protein
MGSLDRAQARLKRATAIEGKFRLLAVGFFSPSFS